VEAVIGSGVREVVVAMTDPNPRVAGRGVRALKRNGIRVRLGLLSDDARELNRAFTTSITSKRPYVTLKAAMSLDGKTATGTGESKWITGAAARSMGHAMRAEAGAIAVGVNTVLRDNPSLSAHGKGRDPLRVVFDRRLRTPRTANVVSGRARTLLFCSSAAPAARRKFAGRSNVDVVPIAGNKSGLRVREALRVLHENGVAHLLVEGGGTLAASFLEERLVDEVVWFVAPILIGGALARTPLEGRGFARLRGAPRIRKWRIAEIGDDLCIRGTVGY